MKIYIQSILGLLFVGVLGCSKITALDLSDGNTRSKSGLKMTAIGNVQYFGWMHDSSQGVGNGDYMSEIAPHSNYTFIYANSPNQDGSLEVAKIRKARDLNLKAILAVGGVFFNGHKLGIDPSESARRWEMYANNVASYENDILAFYIDDEPELFIFNQHLHNELIRNGLIPASMTMQDHWNQYLQQANAAVSLIKRRFPNIKVIMNFSAAVSQLNLQLPANFDWLGIYCYGPWDNCMSSGESFPQIFNRFKANLHPHQKIFVIPESTDFYYLWTNTPVDIRGMTARVNNYIQLANSEPLIVAFMSFLWQSPNGADPNDANAQMKGARDLPDLRSAWTQIGMTISRSVPMPVPEIPSPAPAPTPTVQNSLLSGQSLTPGRQITSTNGQHVLVYQGDGNLVLYSNGRPVFSTGTFGNPGQAVMQGDGNFVVYRSNNSAVYQTRTSGNPGSRLVLEDEGRVVVYSAQDRVLWSQGASAPNPTPNPSPGPSPAPQPQVNSTNLVAGQRLVIGQELISPNRQYKLIYQGDGNLVLYNTSNNSAVWDSYSFGSPGFVEMQGYGNFVIYNSQDEAVMNTRTNGNSGAYLALQDDGRLVIYRSNGTALWSRP